MQSTTHHCPMCSRPDSADNMVACDVCDAWIHYQCAGVTDSIAGEDRSFRCETCKANEKAKDDVRSQARGSVHSSRSSRRTSRVDLALQKLEEERALRLKQLEEEEAARRKQEEEEEIVRKKKHKEEEESRRKRAEEEEKYIKQKYDLLIAEAEGMDDGESRKSRVSSRTSQERVREWLGSKNQLNPIGKDAVNPVPGCSSTNTEPPTATTAVVLQNPAPSYENPASEIGTPVGRIHRPIIPTLEAMLQGNFASTPRSTVAPRTNNPVTSAYTVAPIVDESLNPISPGGLVVLTQSRFDFSSPAILSSTVVPRTGSAPITYKVPEISVSLPVSTVATGAFGDPPVCLALQPYRWPNSSESSSIASNVTIHSRQPRIPSYWELLEIRNNSAIFPRTSERSQLNPVSSSQQHFLENPLPIARTESSDFIRPPVRTLPYAATSSSTPAVTSAPSVRSFNPSIPRIPRHTEPLHPRSTPAPVSQTSELRPCNPVCTSEQRFFGDTEPVYRTESVSVQNFLDASSASATLDTRTNVVQSSYPYALPQPGSVPSLYPTSFQQQYGGVDILASSAYYSTSSSMNLPQVTAPVVSMPLPAVTQSFAFGSLPRVGQNPNPVTGIGPPQATAPAASLPPPAWAQSFSFGGLPRVGQNPNAAAGMDLPPVTAPAVSMPAATQSFTFGGLPRVDQIPNPAPGIVPPQVTAPTASMPPPAWAQPFSFGGVPRVGQNPNSAPAIGLPQVTAPATSLHPPAMTDSFSFGGRPRVGQIPNPAPGTGLPQVTASVVQMPPVILSGLPAVQNLFTQASTCVASNTGLNVTQSSYPYQSASGPSLGVADPQTSLGLASGNTFTSGPATRFPRVTEPFVPSTQLHPTTSQNPFAFGGQSTAGHFPFGFPAQPIVSSFTAAPAGPSPAQLAARQVMPRELPTFSGDPQDWPLFYSSFRNSTEACGFTDAENLARLQRCLKGQALESVRSRLLLPESVPQVMDTLQKLFGRPEVLIHALLNQLRSIPSPRADNFSSIITFGLAVRNVVDHMTVAGLYEHLQNPMLLHELVEKLPSQTKLEWSCYKRRFAVVNLGTFGAFMTGLVDIVSDVTLPSAALFAQAKSSKNEREKPKFFLHSVDEENPECEAQENGQTLLDSEEKTCTYCSNPNHEIANCDQFKSLNMDGRWKLIRQRGLCRTCLIPHRNWPCRSGKECGIDGCRIRHHTLLHSRPVTEPTVPSTNNNVAHINHHFSAQYSLFKYLPVTLQGNGKEVETYAFLDDGSTSTLLEAELATELGISGPAEKLCLGWTGNISREEKNSQRVSLIISGHGRQQKFKLNNIRTVEKLNLPRQSLQYQEMQNVYPHLKGLPIHSYRDATPRLIIGLEHARLLTTLKVREDGDDDPVAAKTRLGWCVFGHQSNLNESVAQLHVHVEASGSISARILGSPELHGWGDVGERTGRTATTVACVPHDPQQ